MAVFCLQRHFLSRITRISWKVTERRFGTNHYSYELQCALYVFVYPDCFSSYWILIVNVQRSYTIVKQQDFFFYYIPKEGHEQLMDECLSVCQ